MADLECLDVGLGDEPSLQGCNHGAGFAAEGALFVELRIIALADEAAIAGEQRQFVVERGSEIGGEADRCGGKGSGEPLEHCGKCLGTSQQARGGDGTTHGPADGGEVARTAAIEGEAGQGAGKVGYGLEFGAQPPRKQCVFGQEGHRIEPVVDGGGIGEGRRQPGGKQARTRRGDRQVDAVAERAGDLPTLGLGELEAHAGGSVDGEVPAGTVDHRRP